MALSPTDLLRVNPALELVANGPTVALSRGSRAFADCDLVNGDVSALISILEAVASERSVEKIVTRLAARMPDDVALATLEQLLSSGWLQHEVAAKPRLPRVLLVAGPALSGLLVSELALQNLALPTIIEPVMTPQGSDAQRFPALSQLTLGLPEFEADDYALAVLALEGVPYDSVDAMARELAARGLACLCVAVEGCEGRVGPLLVPGTSEGFLASRHSLMASALASAGSSSLAGFGVRRLSSNEVALRKGLGREAVGEIARALSREQLPPSLRSVLCVDALGNTRRVPLSDAHVEHATASANSKARDFALEADVLAARATTLSERAERPPSTQIRRVGIVGGGTAGYLTALALRAKLPELEVTLIESSKIPIIGVGEATTALLNHFLHGYLGLDILDFYERVQPTWKLGIRFEWGLPGDYFYNSPFQFGKLLESLVYENDINQNCLGSLLMSANTTPVLRARDGSPRSLLSEVPYAYHLDNRRFVRYLQEEARRAGVIHMDAVIENAVASADRSAIEHLRTDDGRELRFDLYVDCSGFRSLLLDKALGSPFTSYAASLFADTAVVANVPHDGLVKPYTVAETMDHGWCWNIPMPDEDHRGYVFASAFASVDQAAQELRAKNPRMSEPWTVRFRSGRHAEFWRGNCVAIGNSFAFVEPLQSTAIHMIVVEIQKLVSSFPREPALARFQPFINREINEVWDTLRWFLSAHYRFNRRLDTPFWKECRANCDTSGIDELIELYRERAPIGATAHRLRELDLSTFGVYRYDLLFMGMGLEARFAAPDDDLATWRRAVRATQRLAERALPFAAALEVLRENPELLRRHAAELAVT